MTQMLRLEVEAEPVVIEPPERVDPNYELEHPAGAPVFADWVDVLLPMRHARGLGVTRGNPVVFRTTSGLQHPAVVHRRRGHQGYHMRVLATFPQRIVAGDFVPMPTPWQEPFAFALHPSVQAIPMPVTEAGKFVRIDIVAHGPAEVVERLLFRGQRGAVVVWRRVRWMHPVVDYGVRWIGQGGRPYWVNFPGADQVELVPWCRFSDIDLDEGRLKLINSLDWACAPTVWLQATYPRQSEESPIEEQLRAFCGSGWPVGVCRTWQTEDGSGTQRWGPLGIMPSVRERDALVIAEQTDGLFSAAPASIYERRPYAQALATNQAGTQRFGLADGLVAQLSPVEAFRTLRVCAQDEELRPVHWLTQEGEIARKVNRPDLRSHNRRLDWRNSRDKLVLATEPPRVAPTSRRTADDEQHTDDLVLDACLGLWDDPALEETRQHIVEIEAMDTQRIAGRTNTAARGIGRPLVSMASAAWLLAETDSGILAQANIMAEVHALQSTWEGRLVDPERPIRPIATLLSDSWALTDPRTRLPMRAAAPYEHATAVAGLIAAAQVLRPQESVQALGLAALLTTTVLAWAYEDGPDWKWPFVVGVLDDKAELGLALPREWCDPQRPEFRLTHIPGGSWTDWTACVAFAAAYLCSHPHAVLGQMIPPELVDRAAMIRAQYQGAQSYLAERMTALPMSVGQAAPVVPVGVAT